MTDYFKILHRDGYPAWGGAGKWRKGRWRSVRGELVPCENGLHLCTLEQLPDWLGPTIWRAEVHPDSEIIEDRDKVVVRKARVVERLPWDERTAWLFAADCVEHTLPLFESEHPDHERRLLIETARAYARGEIEPEELRAVWLVWDVDARGSAAARHIAHRAAWSGAAAVLNATAAWDAAWDAAWAAASAALDAERAWQAQRLARYLGIDGGRN